MIFKWNSEYLKQYGSGTIIVGAENVEEARKKVLEKFEEWDKEYNDWNYESCADEDDLNDISERLKILFTDISVEPDMNDTHFILGSD